MFLILVLHTRPYASMGVLLTDVSVQNQRILGVPKKLPQKQSWQNANCLRSYMVQTLNKLKRPTSEADPQARCKRDRRSR